MAGTRRSAYLAIGGTALAAVLAGAVPLLADDEGSVTVRASADTTVTAVRQDGDNGTKTTLATCPELCEGNPAGWRDAVIEFAVSGLPANATRIRARLRLHSWADAPARTEVFGAAGGARGSGDTGDRPALDGPLDRNATVREGGNEWDVSAALAGNGTYTFTVRQESHHSRIYWASRENRDEALRPRLTLTYDTSPGGTRSPSRPASPSPSASPPGWRLVWSDEFDGSTLDRTRWNARNDAWVDYDRACITDRDRNVFVGGGLLTLRARAESFSCGSQRRDYTTAYLDTVGTASFTYGRFEIRAKSPTGPGNSTGLWPAFWLRPDDGGNGEIDVVELAGGDEYHRAATQAIFYDYTPVKQDNRYAFPSGHPADGFHTYAAEWEPGVLRWYVDGRQVWQRDRGSTPWFDEVFQRPYHLRLNFQVGGWLGDPDDSTAFPADFRVDYVRVWQR
ncbi:glycoside hydrolase family 16 protein [Micromonospora sp. NPDC049559]|uniref:glycoside hydrolase family 16 protein n=1 Tax=Micromonospora sp. NPDC049559 TaxID=3155923 RepID=UPI00343DC332